MARHSGEAMISLRPSGASCQRPTEAASVVRRRLVMVSRARRLATMRETMRADWMARTAAVVRTAVRLDCQRPGGLKRMECWVGRREAGMFQRWSSRQS